MLSISLRMVLTKKYMFHSALGLFINSLLVLWSSGMLTLKLMLIFKEVILTLANHL